MTLNIQSCNVRGLNAKQKRIALFEHMRKQNADVFLIQETHSTANTERAWERNWGGRTLFSHNTSRSAGVAILFSSRLHYERYIEVIPGRMQVIQIKIKNKLIGISNIYAPNHDTEQVQFYEKVQTELQKIKCDDWIIGGDYNLVLDPQLDKKGGNNPNKKSLHVLKNIITSMNLIDSYRHQFPDKNEYTWRQTRPKVSCRLDYFLVSKDINTATKHNKIIYMPFTDHKSVRLHFELDDTHKKPNLWKFNNSFLQDNDFVRQMNTLITEKWTDYTEVDDLRIRYELLKYEIQQFAMKYGKKKAKSRRQRENELTKNIETIEKKLETGFITDQEQTELNNNKSELENLLIYRAKGEEIRSKSDFIECNEKSTAFFFNQTKVNYERKTIDRLQNKEGNVILNEKDINVEIRSFYENLYSSKIIHPENDIWYDQTALQNLPRLSDRAKTSLEQNLTIEELQKALSDLANKKSPGVDGLTAEFFKTFFNTLGPLILQTYNYSRNNGHLPISLRRAVITLLHKKGKNPEEIKNWRPISLLTVDYKILTKCIANRIFPLLPSIINEDQTGFIKGRFIGENIRLIDDLLLYTKREQIEGLLLQLDFEKAFDSIEWSFIYKTLREFNFGPNISSWIKLCYTEIFSTIINKGSTCGWFSLHRGVRQGCPLSTILFILCVEILAEIIRTNNEIKGIVINGKELKLSQYADDTTSILGTVESVFELFRITLLFEKKSGLRLNKSKTLLIWLGPWRKRKDTVQNLMVCDSSFNNLGIELGYDQKQCDQKISTQKFLR